MYMASITDKIELFINELMNNSNSIQIKRNELANLFNCAPSQINYVLMTRFTIDRGYYIDSKKGDQHKRHGHDQLAHGAVAGKHDQQCVGYQHCVHEPVLFFKAEGAVNLVDGDQGDGCDHQIEHHGVEGKHHADEHQNAHDRSNNACFHRFDLLCSSGSSPLQGNAFRPEEVPGLSGLHHRCRVCNTDRLPLRCRRTGGCGG